MMLRARKLMISLGLVVLLVGGGAVVALVPGGSHSAEAQQGAKASGPMRVGVVDFTRLSRDLSDVEKIRTLMSLLDELRQTEERYYRERIEVFEREIETARTHRLQEELEENERLRREAQASFDAVEQVIEFRMKKNATMYSSRLLQKILERIELYSEGRFDIVFKVLGDPAAEEGAGEDLVGDAQKLNLAQAREVLYYDTQSDYVTDITERVRRMVNDPGGAGDVSQALDDAISRVRDEIADVRDRIAASN